MNEPDIITAVLGDMSIHEAELPGLLDDGPGVLAGLVVVRRLGNDLLFGELAGQLLEGFLLIAQL